MKFNKSEKVFTIGSCFAREIRYYLTSKGFEVYPEGEASSLVFYNTYSINYEFFPPANREIDVIQNSDRQWQEPTRRMVLAPTKADVIIKSRLLTKQMNEYISKSKVFIITLGMTECFKSDNLVWSVHPQYGLKKGIRSGGLKMVEFFNSTVKENYVNLLRVVEILKGKKLIFTVSPVPLTRTFRKGINTKAANIESKDCLRSVAKTLARDYEWVTYYDSYEYCQELHRRDNIYKGDGRHIKREVVTKVVDRFMERHFEQTAF